MSDIQDLYNKRANVFSNMEEIKARGFKKAEDRAAWDAAETELDALTDEIGEKETDAKADKALAGYKATQEQSKGDPDSPKAQYARAFRNFLTNGIADLEPEDRKLMQSALRKDPEFKAALGAGTSSAGGYTVPQGFRDVLIETLKYYGPMLTAVDSITTETGATLPWPTNDDTGNMGALLSENTQAGQQDTTFGQEELGAFTYTSKIILASLQLLQDSAFDLDTWLPKKMAQRLGRIFNNHFTVGTGGGSQPEGIVTGASTGVTGTGSFAATSGISYPNLVDIVESLDPAYGASNNLSWMGHQTMRKAIRKLVDSQNRPLWEPSLQSGTPDTLLGYPYLINNDMATLAASSKSLGFGDLNLAYVTRYVQEIDVMRLTERYADYLQVGFLAFQRADGQMQDTAAFKLFGTTVTA